jgi:mannose-1-phosphate guanylyltransferase
LKAFLLAAGLGTRLRPLTDQIPKCLAPIRGKPLLCIWLELCRKYGITEVLINVHAHPEVVQEQAALYSSSLNIHMFHEEVLLGSAGTIAVNRQWVEAEPCFWIFYADVLTNVNLSQMLTFHRVHKAAATLGVYEVENPSACGIAVVDEKGLVLRFVEKPSDPPSELAFSGILLGTQVLLDAIPSRCPADLGFDVFPQLAGNMFAYPIKEYLLDIGTPEKYDRAQNTWPGI